MTRSAPELVRLDRASVRPVVGQRQRGRRLLRRACARADGPVVELGVGTGRIAVPIAAAGVPVIGVDSSRGMLEVCAEAAALAAGVAHLVDLRVGDLLDPPVQERVRLVICPSARSCTCIRTTSACDALRAARELLVPGGRFVFDVFAPGDDDIAETHGRWLEREPGIFERADWDTEPAALTLSVRGETAARRWCSPGSPPTSGGS